jgi:hypothetical protein
MVVLAAVGTLFLVPAVAAGQSDDVKVQQALDKPVEYAVEDAPIREIFAGLAKTAGVAIEVHEDTLAMLPYGSQTRMKVTLKNIQLRKALDTVLSKHALHWKVREGKIVILPSEALYRSVRRVSFDELKVLGVVHSARLFPKSKKGEVIEQLRKATDNEELKLRFKVRNVQPEDFRKTQEAAMKRAEEALPGSGQAWLNMLCLGQDWTWYVEGDTIVVIDRKSQLERQLQQQVTLQYKKANLRDVLFDLAGRGQFRLTLSPGVLTYLPASVQDSTNLVMKDVTIAQALEAISGATGLEFQRTSSGVRVEPSETLKQASDGANTRRERPSFFVQLKVDLDEDSTMMVFIRDSELPEEVVKLIEAEKEQFVQSMLDKAKARSAETDGSSED